MWEERNKIRKELLRLKAESRGNEKSLKCARLEKKAVSHIHSFQPKKESLSKIRLEDKAQIRSITVQPFIKTSKISKMVHCK